MKNAPLLPVVILTFLGCPALVPIMGAAEINVRNAGATGDGKTLDTEAIQRAVDTCHRQGGGAVRFPAGQYISGTILLQDNVRLQLDTNAVLLGSLNIADYQAPDKFRSGNGAEMGYCFIGAVDAHNVGIEGAGLIDGRGKELLAARPKGNNARPFLIRFVRSDGVRVSGVRLQGPAAWTMHFSQCRNVQADRVTINSRGLSNNDGIDIDSSQGVRIRDCDIDSGDDAICLKTTSASPCRNVEISGCRLRSRWAAIKFGTESVANFEEIRITDCRIRDTQGGGIKLLSVDGARLQNVLIADLTMENVNLPVFIRLGARLKTFRPGDPPQPVGTISNVVIKNVRASAVSRLGILISGIPGHPVNDVTLENLDIQLPGGGTRAEAGVVLPEKESA
jgi:polygalacturonase